MQYAHGAAVVISGFKAGVVRCDVVVEACESASSLHVFFLMHLPAESISRCFAQKPHSDPALSQALHCWFILVLLVDIPA